MRRNAEKLLLMQVVRNAAGSLDAAHWLGFTTPEALGEKHVHNIGKGKRKSLDTIACACLPESLYWCQYAEIWYLPDFSMMTPLNKLPAN